MSSLLETAPAIPTRELAAIMFSDIAGYTRIMGRDETLAIRVLAEHRQILKTLLPRFNGKLIGEIGDGTLSSFHSAVDAVNCAREVQSALQDDVELQLRIGIHVGDVLLQDNTVLGDGVNVASRLHAMAAPGGVCISERVYDEIRNQPDLPTRFLGQKNLKNVSRPINVYELAMPGGAHDANSIARRARMLSTRRSMLALVALALSAFLIAFLYPRLETLARIYVPRLLPPEVKQQIGNCITIDGVRIAYGVSGHGPPVVMAVGFLTHLQLGLFSPTYNSAFLKPLVAHHTVIQYDGRGFGLSDRGLKDYSVEARLRDLEAVVDHLKLERFALYGISAGAEVTIAYAARHPERVSRMVVYGGDVEQYVDPNASAEQKKLADAASSLIVNGWALPSVREFFASLVMPNATAAERRFYAEIMGEAVTPEDFAAFGADQKHVDVKSNARQVRTPTLVINARGDITKREFFASLVMPNATAAERRFYAEIMGEAVTPEDFAAFGADQKHVDVKSNARQVRTPTLVINARGDITNPVAAGRLVAELIPGARFVVIEGTDHIPMPGDGETEALAQLVVPFLDADLQVKASAQPPTH